MALLSIEDYSLKIGWRYQIGSERIDTTWKTLFHTNKDNINKIHDILYQLLKKADKFSDNILFNIVNEYLLSCQEYDWRYYSGMPGTCKVRTNKVVYFVQNPICFTGSFVKTEILWAFFAYFARTRKPQKRMAAFASSAVGSTTGTVRPTASAAKGSSVQPSRNTPAPRVIICSTTVKRSAR